MKLVLLAFLQATWTVDPAPVLKIGDINGDVTFTQVAGATTCWGDTSTKKISCRRCGCMR